MALVPFRVAGAAADQSLETRTFQIGGHTLSIRQDPRGSGALRTLRPTSGDAEEGAAATSDAGSTGRSSQRGEGLEMVGLVVWQSAFVLAEYLLRAPPFGQWADVRAVDLGTGTGVVAIALALAGADMVGADLPRVTPLARDNAAANCRSPLHRMQIVDHAWGSPVAALGPRPDLITGADIVYEERCFEDLVATLRALAAPHTLVVLAYRLRGRGEAQFEALLAASGFAVRQVPTAALHEEYRGGEYRVLRASLLDP
ncbi:hypothetical protein WJX81_003588 [Elliptochloris bilobata]|uniref:Uncharacterized protein n=1 Tax=Elliptochloris bilobata TaxID=381761 RepID=A0AAW1RY20_9CHLO